MRLFHQVVYINQRAFNDEQKRREAIAQARHVAARWGFRGHVQFAWRNAGHAGELIAIRVWPW